MGNVIFGVQDMFVINRAKVDAGVIFAQDIAGFITPFVCGPAIVILGLSLTPRVVVTVFFRLGGPDIEGRPLDTQAQVNILITVFKTTVFFYFLFLTSCK